MSLNLRGCKWLLFVLLAIPGAAHATTTISGNLKDLGTNASSGFVRFTLKGCGGNQATVPGVAVLAPTQGAVWFKDFVADASGHISGTIYSTRDSTGLLGGDIECGTSFTSVYYGMSVWVGGKSGPEIGVHAKNGATLDPGSVTPITTNPVTTAPTGDSTYARLDGGNMPFIGNVQASQLISTIATGTAPLSVNSTTVVPNLNASKLGGFNAPSTAIVGLSDTQVLANKTFDISANTLKNSTNTAGHYPRNNGTNYVDGTIAGADLPATASNCTGNNFAQGLNAGGTPICGAASVGVTESTFGWGAVSQTTAATSTFICSNSSSNPIVCPETVFAKAHTLVRFTYNLVTAPLGCSTQPVIGVRDDTAGSVLTSLSIANSQATGFVDSGALSIATTAGNKIGIGQTTVYVGCSTAAVVANLTAVFQ
jgi:hypothetical protein